MRSLRIRLFALVATVTLLVWSGAAAWTAISTRAEIERVLDRRLVEAARMVAALDVAAGTPAKQAIAAPYSRELSCQIWSLGGGLLGQSAGAPDVPLAGGAPGFSERSINEHNWRVYTHIDTARSIRVMVGDNLAVRQRLLRDLMFGLLLPASVGLAALAMLLWLGVRRGLSPLQRLTAAIDSRSPDSLLPLETHAVPSELGPLVRAMDELLRRLDAARQAERAFVANAAHELQTPLAGLKTQAEVARRATDDGMRDHALERITVSVDRTSRLVRQLLDLARQEAQARGSKQTFTRLGDVIEAVEHDYGLIADLKERQLKTACRHSGLEIALDQESLRLALGNLVENAIHHGQPGSVGIKCVLADTFELHVTDVGRGIARSDQERVRRRFERGPGAQAGGTGLGLAIVEAAIAPADGVLELVTHEGGFTAVLRFPRSRIREGTT
ncbi:sensor histidine kinase N-terminal domain-containing protein [Sphingomonas sp. S1-29]|uniref:ATP-binding protein n=1 Tax=Sphingomonas sp. S1-29 TaxID=2991074 RepID=UPI00223FFE3B|nr:ATP-binding protein [Sphingomonas sp. S1-29]UZK70599.1 sensor histidine kinase N-terminal domain-containing protein [Sphingomonas sp. S1-29]